MGGWTAVQTSVPTHCVVCDSLEQTRIMALPDPVVLRSHVRLDEDRSEIPLHVHVADGDIAGVADSTTASIRGLPMDIPKRVNARSFQHPDRSGVSEEGDGSPHPRLEIQAVLHHMLSRRVECDAVHGDVLDPVHYSRYLSYGPKRNAGPAIASEVADMEV